MPQETPSSNTIQRPRISPGERDYLRKQTHKILSSGGSEEDVVNFVQTHVGMPLGARVSAMRGAITETGGAATRDNLVSGLSLNALQGVTFGFGDEAVGSLLGILTGEGAAGGRESYRARLQEWNAANPKKAFGAELLGAALTGGGVARALGMGAKAAGAVARGASVAAEGAAFGAAAAAGHAEGSITDRAKAALVGGALGGVAGPAFVGGARLAGTVTKPAVRAVLDNFKGLQSRIPGLGSSVDHAREFFLRTIEADGLSVDALRTAAAHMRANGVSPTLADIGGEGVLGLLGETLSSRTPIKQWLAEALLTRQAEQGARLSGAFFQRIMKLDKFGLRNAYETVEALATQRAKAAAPLYEESYQHVIPTTPRIQQILGNPKFRAAWEEGRRIAQSEELAGVGRGLDIPDIPATSLRDAAEQQLLDLGVTGSRLDEMLSQLPDAFPDVLPVRGIDYMKRGLDAVIKRGINSGKVTDAQEMRALRAMQEEVLGMADDAVPAFGRARSVWGGMTQSMEAVELGQQFISKAPALVSKELAELSAKSPGLADFYRLGAAQTLYERSTGAITRGEKADVANRIFGGRIFGGANQDALRIRALFPDAPEIAEDFMSQVAAEARISHTTRAARGGGSSRALQQFEEAVEGTPPNVRMTPELTLLGAMQQGIVRLQRNFRQDVSDDLAVMFSKGLDDPAALDMLLEILDHVELRRIARRRFGRQADAALAAAIGTSGGKLVGSAR